MRHQARGVRRWMVCVALLSGVAGCASWAFAEAVGSPAGILKKGKWVMGLGGGGLVERLLRPDTAKATAYNLGHFRGYGLTDWLSLYGKIGAAYLQVEDDSIKPDATNAAPHAFDVGVLVSVQIKGRIWQHVKTGLEWDGGVQYTDLRARHRGGNDGHWREWVLATSVAKSVGRLKPYLGLKYSVVDFDVKIRKDGALFQQRTYKDDGRVGVFFGTDVYFGEQEDVIINVETSYLDGPEIDVAVSYLF